jgi:ribosomal protein L37AE/L43A
VNTPTVGSGEATHASTCIPDVGAGVLLGAGWTCKQCGAAYIGIPPGDGRARSALQGRFPLMETFNYGSDTAAIREASSESPWRCPWCGENSWIVSREDVGDDLGRVQMFCTNTQCESQETELLIVRAYGVTLAQKRADVRALRAIDDGVPEGYLVTGRSMSHQRFSSLAERASKRVGWRQSQTTYTMEVRGWDQPQRPQTPENP